MRTKYLFLLLAMGALLFLFRIGERDLWDPDETRDALVAREMRESGDWILPHFNGGIYAEKPPPFFWLVNFWTFFLERDSSIPESGSSPLWLWRPVFYSLNCPDG